MPSLAQPVERGLDLGGLAVDFADDPAPVLLHVGPPDVGLHVELAHQGGQDGPAHLGLGKRQLHLDPDFAHWSSSRLSAGDAAVHAARAEAFQVQGDEA